MRLDKLTLRIAMHDAGHLADVPDAYERVHGGRLSSVPGAANCIAHLLKQFPYVEVHKDPIVLPEREHHEHYSRQSVPPEMLVPEAPTSIARNELRSCFDAVGCTLDGVALTARPEPKSAPSRARLQRDGKPRTAD